MLITDFTAGELSPKIAGRTDLPLYNKGCAELENWVPFIQGGITTRPGTKYIGATKTNASYVRLVAFNISDSVGILLEMGVVSGVGYVRFWYEDTLLESGGSPIEFTSDTGDFPYNTATYISELQFAQDGPDIFIAHRSFAPRKLSFISTTSFSIGIINIEGNSGELPFQAAGNYPGCVAIWGGRLWFASSLNDPQRIWASDVWDADYTYTHFYFYETVEYTTQQARKVAGYFSCSMTSGSTTLSVIDSTVIALMKVGDSITGTGIPDDTTIVSISTNSIVISNAAIATSTSNKPYHSWPDPTRVEYEDVTTTKDIVSDSNALDFVLGSEQIEKIQWLAPGTDLIVGCASSEFVIPNGVTANAIEAHLQTRYGSAPLQGFMLGYAVVFAQSGKKKLREYYYQDSSSAYQSPELTYHAEHILGTGIKSIDFSQNPQPMVYAVREDGELAVLVYERTYSIEAWCRYVIDGTFGSVAVIVDNDGNDRVYASVTINDVMQIVLFDNLDEIAYNLDSYSIHTKSATITGLSRFNTKTVSIIHGEDVYTAVVSAGSVAIPDAIAAGETIAIGLAYTCTGKTNKVNQFTLKRIPNVYFMLLDSYQFKLVAGNYEDTLSFEEPFTGDFQAPCSDNWDREPYITFKQDKPLPVTILSIAPEVK